jgi:2-dehydro-3-deoxyphosphogluconate aldolase/(4S)-4-hydroxy-2-oxoglutarate aldolase
MNIYEQIKNYKLVPVVVINNIDEAIPTMEALVKGGLPVAEITFRTACAHDSQTVSDIHGTRTILPV